MEGGRGGHGRRSGWQLLLRSQRFQRSSIADDQSRTLHIFYWIVESEMGSVGRRYLAQSSGHRGKQFWQVVMVNHKVRHLEQSFVTRKIRVRVEMTFHT